MTEMPSRRRHMHRREFIALLGGAAATSSVTCSVSWPLAARAQQTVQRETAAMATLNKVRTKFLEIAYEESGPETGVPVLLMHGFPYDPRAYDDVVPRLVGAGCRTIVPYLRGFRPTPFLSAAAKRF